MFCTFPIQWKHLIVRKYLNRFHFQWYVTIFITITYFSLEKPLLIIIYYALMQVLLVYKYIKAYAIYHMQIWCGQCNHSTWFLSSFFGMNCTWTSLLNAWKAICKEILRKLIGRMPRLYHAVIKAKEGHIYRWNQYLNTLFCSKLFIFYMDGTEIKKLFIFLLYQLCDLFTVSDYINLFQ